MAGSRGLRLLVVDDDVDVADAYASQLRERYDVETAYSGEGALSALAPDVDIVLLDRRMPKLSGCEVLDAIRERGLETRVAMVTAEEPDFDIIEMPFDEYVQKPVTQDALFETVAHLGRCVHYEEQVREYYALTAKRSALLSSKSDEELAATAQYQTLLADIEAARESLSALVADFDHADFDRAFRDIERSSTSAD